MPEGHPAAIQFGVPRSLAELGSTGGGSAL